MSDERLEPEPGDSKFHASRGVTVNGARQLLELLSRTTTNFPGPITERDHLLFRLGLKVGERAYRTRFPGHELLEGVTVHGQPVEMKPNNQ